MLAHKYRRLFRFALRDGALLASTGFVWALALRRAGEPGTATTVINVLAGLASGGPAYLLHEWGHLAGAWSRRSVVQIPERVSSPFLFNFDVGRNDRAQFTAMAVGGFIASLAYFAFVALAAPWPQLCGKIAVALNGVGIATILILEVPTAWRVYRGAPLPQSGAAFVSTNLER